ncbi:hypothetical protein E6C27_scaffold233G00350 [Cucumis melo var. makuwa]|uniref:Uncharacterized protein n=1 Tax=Cucumis melo var. makuwa TaxID=1194695 RepID=A0A5A7UZK1_CUCMM|nr:hypothetical protein E6C27_scaffold233G00350 [Cucumis melo var. makuwa]
MAATLEEEIKEHKHESDSSKSDRHWKRVLKKEKVSSDDPDGRDSSALEVPDVPPLSPLNDHLEGLIDLSNDESLMGPHAVDSTIEEEIRRGKMTLGVLHPKEMSALKHPYRRLRPEIATVHSKIEKIHADGLTPLEEYLNSSLKRVDKFKNVQSSYSTQLLSTDKARQLDEKTSAIKEALTLMEQL